MVGEGMKSLVILVDYRDCFYSRCDNQRTLCTMYTSRIVSYLRELRVEAQVKRFEDVDLSADWNGIPVVYTSSEDGGLLYKGYIEDIILALQIRGANLIPGYCHLRAHHNKAFMEAMRYSLYPVEANRLNTRIFGAFEEVARADFKGSWPKIIKSAYGAGSRQVFKANGREELLSIAGKISTSVQIRDAFREVRSRFLWRGYSKRSLRRNKLIVQDFVPNMDGDFKVLRYGRRFYTLWRRNRKGDFRASGSGDFCFDLPPRVNGDDLLTYARDVSSKLKTPLCSLDIGFDGAQFFLIEFQSINFGPLTAERSTHYSEFVDGAWVKVFEKCDLEYVFSEAIAESINAGGVEGAG